MIHPSQTDEMDKVHQSLLLGRRVLITAEAQTAQRFRDRLEELGAVPLMLPCIRVVPIDDEEELARSLSCQKNLDWLVITSRNGADALGRLKTFSELTQKRIAAVGPSTKRRLERLGFKVDLVPPQATARALASSLAQQIAPGETIALLQNNLAKDGLETELRRHGARVLKFVVYETVEGVEDPRAARALFQGAASPEVVTFMSGSAVRALSEAVGDDLLCSFPLVCIGPATAEVVEQLGFRPTKVASPHTLEGLVHAVIEVFRKD